MAFNTEKGVDDPSGIVKILNLPAERAKYIDLFGRPPYSVVGELLKIYERRHVHINYTEVNDKILRGLPRMDVGEAAKESSDSIEVEDTPPRKRRRTGTRSMLIF